MLWSLHLDSHHSLPSSHRIHWHAGWIPLVFSQWIDTADFFEDQNMEGLRLASQAIQSASNSTTYSKTLCYSAFFFPIIFAHSPPRSGECPGDRSLSSLIFLCPMQENINSAFHIKEWHKAGLYPICLNGGLLCLCFCYMSLPVAGDRFGQKPDLSDVSIPVHPGSEAACMFQGDRVHGECLSGKELYRLHKDTTRSVLCLALMLKSNLLWQNMGIRAEWSQSCSVIYANAEHCLLIFAASPWVFWESVSF